MARAELIDNLNKALSLELSGIIQYSQHSYLVTGIHREVYKKIAHKIEGGYFDSVCAEARSARSGADLRFYLNDLDIPHKIPGLKVNFIQLK